MPLPLCSCGGKNKPDVVLYEEGLDNDTVSGAIHAISSADLMIVAGTSLTVYPAAGLIRYFRGKHMVLINRDATPMDSECDLVIHDKVGEVLGSLTKLFFACTNSSAALTELVLHVIMHQAKRETAAARKRRLFA